MGHLLAAQAGEDYESLLRRRVLEPLGLHSTFITLSKADQERLAPGHKRGVEAGPGLGPAHARRRRSGASVDARPV